MAPSAAGAGLVDLDLGWKSGELTGCREWRGSGTVTWNLSLAMNGTDTSAATTPTYFFLNDSAIPARQEGWVFVIGAGGGTNGTTPPFDDAASNTFAVGNAVYDTTGIDLRLYSSAYSPGAPPANISITLTPVQGNTTRTFRFDAVALTHSSGMSPQIRRALELCVTLRVPYSFEIETGYPDPIGVDHNATVTPSWQLSNNGTNLDTYRCTLQGIPPGWRWDFAQGLDANGTATRPAGSNLFVHARVTVPAGTPPGTTANAALVCTSDGGAVAPPPRTTPITVLPSYDVCGAIVGPSTLEVSPNHSGTFTFVIENLGNAATNGTVTLSSGNASWVDLSPTGAVSLSPWGQPGATAAGTLVVTPPPGAPKGPYSFQLRFQSLEPGVAGCNGVSTNVLVPQVFDVRVSSTVPVAAAPGTEAPFEVTVTNVGNALDSIGIMLYNLSGWYVVVEPAFDERVFSEGESFTFNVTVGVPLVPLLAGNYHTGFHATSNWAAEEGLHVSASVNLTVTVPASCGASLSLPVDRIDVNPYGTEPGTLPVRLQLRAENTGNWFDNLTAQANTAGATLTFYPPSFELAAWGTGLVEFDVTVNHGLPSGELRIAIQLESSCAGGVLSSIDLNVTVFRIDAGLQLPIKMHLQDPANANAVTWNTTTSTVASQQEGSSVRFEVEVANLGDRPLGSSQLSLEFIAWMDCSSSDLAQRPGECSAHVIHSWTPSAPILPKEAKVVAFEWRAPNWVCLLQAGCPAPAAITYHVIFRLRCEDQSSRLNDEAEIALNVGELPPPPTGHNVTQGGNQTNTTGGRNETVSEGNAFLGTPGESFVAAGAAFVALAFVLGRGARGRNLGGPRR